MSYIITNSRSEYVYRNYLGKFMARDHLLPLRRVYDGRLIATGALAFDTEKQAQDYIDCNGWLTGTEVVTRYDPCRNCVVEV